MVKRKYHVIDVGLTSLTSIHSICKQVELISSSHSQLNTYGVAPSYEGSPSIRVLDQDIQHTYRQKICGVFMYIQIHIY